MNARRLALHMLATVVAFDLVLALACEVKKPVTAAEVAHLRSTLSALIEKAGAS